MNLEEQAMNDALNNKGMYDDPKWTAVERQKYQAAYNGAKLKQQS